MKLAQTVIATIAVAAALSLAGCSSESQFPDPTGKGTFRAINAVANSPAVFFRIEESVPSTIIYRTDSESRRIDDFEYNFNFDVGLPEQVDPLRVATVTRKIDRDQDYTFVLIGDISSPEVLTWTSAERVFAEGEVVTEIRLAHLAESLGAADVYFLAEGAVPLLGEERGTYNYRDILPAFDVDPGVYSVVVTAQGDPSTVLFESRLGSFSAGTSMIVAVFDSTVDDTSAYTARAVSKTNAAASFSLPDARANTSVQFVQGSEFIDTADIYDDEALTNRIVAGLPFAGIEPPVEREETSNTFYFTPADSIATVLLEQTFDLAQGVRYDLITLGDADSATSIALQRDRQPIGLYATLSVNSTITTEGFEIIQIYIVPPGTSIEDEIPRSFTGAALSPPVVELLAGQYEMVFALLEDEVTTQLADPVPLDLANGDVARYVLFSTPDPNVIDVQILP